MTTLLLYRGRERVKVRVPRCPMFDFERENETDEVKQLLADGFHISGHIDD